MSKIEELIQQYCPEGVEWKELRELGFLYGGLSGKSKVDFESGNAKFISYMNIFSNISVKTIVEDFVKIGEEERQNKISVGDVLFTGSSESKEEVGMSSVMTNKDKEDFYLNSFCFGFRFNNKNLFLPEFSKFLFRDSKIRKQIIKTASGVTRFNVSKKRFERISIPIPPLPIQKEIVKILDNFTALEAELEAELEARTRQYEYYRNQLLSFEGKDVEWKTLGDVTDIITKGTTPRRFTEKGIAFIKTESFDGPNINISKISYIDELTHHTFLKRSILKKNDILFTIAGATIGKCAIVSENILPANTNQALAIIRLRNSVNTKFVFYLLRSKLMTKYISVTSKGSAQPNLNLKQLNDFIIPIPPLAEQERIVSVLDKFDALVNDISQGLPAEIKARKQQYEYYRAQLLTFKPLC